MVATMPFGPSALSVGGILAMAAAFIGIFLFILLLNYVVGSWATMDIAKRLKEDEIAWYAWVPIANVYLWTRMAQKEWWWMLIVILGGFIPGIGSLIIMGGTIYLWWLIVERMGRPGWLGILMVIPVVNLVALGILAWSK